MEGLNKKSIIDMARGAIKERADYEMTKAVENILDPILQQPPHARSRLRLRSSLTIRARTSP